jgi:hypothetical protein
LPQQLNDAPEPPEDILYVWEWWKDIFTGERLMWAEINSWSQLTGIRPSGVELELIRALDAIYWRACNG